MNVSPRPLEDADLDPIYGQMKVPKPVRMAAFTVNDPDDRQAFLSTFARSR